MNKHGVNWDQIETVLLDMDGTLLDLHFDTHFWLTVIPEYLSRVQQRPKQEVVSDMMQRYQKVAGSLEWYCIEYWQAELGIDIMQLKALYSHKIQWLEDVKPFLSTLKSRNIQRILVTNAHPLSLELKTVHTQLDKYLDKIFSTHQFGVPKESTILWQKLQKEQGYNPQTTLFIDDNEALLTAAKQAGIAYQLGVFQPDSQLPGKEMDKFQTIKNYRELTQELKTTTF